MNAAIEIRPSRALVPLGIGILAAAVALLPSLEYRLLALGFLLLGPTLWFVFIKPQRWLALFFTAALLLPPLPIALGDSGPHVALVFAGLGLFACLLHGGEWRWAPHPVAVRLAVLYAVLLGSVAFALFYSGWTIAAGSLARVLLFAIPCGVFLFSAYGPVGQQRNMTRLLFLLAAGSALFACLDFYFQWPAPAGYGAQFIWLDSSIFRRAQGVFYEASTLGNFCAFFLTMTAVCLLRRQEDSPVPRLWLILVAPALAMALILSFSRASLVNLGIALATLLVLHRGQWAPRRWGLPLGVVLAAGAAAAYAFFPEFTRQSATRAWLSALYFFSYPSSVLSGRLENWAAIARYLVEHPWHLVFGLGYKTLPYSNVLGAPVIADNMYLSLLAETGLVGLSAFLMLNVAILKAGWATRKSFYGAWIFSFWTGQMVQMLSGDLLTYWRVMPVYFWVLGQAIRREDP